jgi:hypothetical protein
MVRPSLHDVVVRPAWDDSGTIYLLGTLGSPNQFFFRNQDEAVSRALAYAIHARVRAWLVTGIDDFTFTLLGTLQRFGHPTDLARKPGPNRSRDALA